MKPILPEGKSTATFKGEVTQAYGSPTIVLVGVLDGGDAFARGRGLFMVPALYSSMWPELLLATRIRRAAVLGGVCPGCEGVLTVETGSMLHEADCPASEPNFVPLLREWAQLTAGTDRGERILEIPEVVV